MKTGTLEPIANTATWRGTVTLIDDDDGTPFDLTDVDTITMKIRDIDGGSTELEGSLSGGEIIVVGDEVDGTVQFTFTATQMATLCPKTYEVGMLVTDDDGFVSQVILGTLPVKKGL